MTAAGVWPVLRRGALLAAVVVPVLTRGGYPPASRVLFVCLAAVALLAAVAEDSVAARRIAREPVVVLLAALAALGAVSALWSIVPVAETLRWAAVAFAYAAVAVAAGVEVSRARSPWPLAVGLAALAAVVGAIGLYAVATFTEPFADRIAGTWRAGGTLEYPPALGLLQVSALPVLLVGMTRGARLPVNVAAAAAAAVAGAALALTASRAQAFLAACLLGAAVVWPRQTLGAPRPRVAAACGLVAIAALAGAVLCDGEATRQTASAEWRALGLLALVLVCAATWGVACRSCGRRLDRMPALGLALLAVAVLAVLALAWPGGHASTDFTHGRIDLWEDGLRAAWERPLLGTGADSFFAATERYQDDAARARFAHDLPLEVLVELGLLGLLLTLALYAAAVRTAWTTRRTSAGWLLAPAVLAFMATNLIDWPWHLAGSGAVWAATFGGLLAVLPEGHLSLRGAPRVVAPWRRARRRRAA